MFLARNKYAQRLAVAAATLAMGATASLAFAPTASAVSIPSKCSYQWNTPHKAKTTTSVNLRTGPSTSYTSLGILAKGTGFTHYCIAAPNGSNWAWGKVTSGANAGKTGWVYYNYLTL
ncbi:SH3 domain-containing protein [Streptomyces sp. NPDC005408]|uniref:SH3 domain-containing protein n=1 Tax=Streptomyces sp. NPDC005408 TaxID=3155341 RepID=UPI0033AD0D89